MSAPQERLTIEVREFRGLRGDASPVTRDPAFHQEDQGGNHEELGVWATRRGMEHTGITKQGGAILGAVGFETANGDIAYAIVAGTNLSDGELAVSSEGYGTGGYGSKAYGS